MRLVVAVTGSSGVVYGARFLEACRDVGIETELIVSKAAEILIRHEMGKNASALKKLAKKVHEPDDLSAPVASGSYKTDGMVVIPCSMKTLGAIANGIADNLITRAADVTLKQERKLVIVPRETPLNLIHLENMAKLRRAGATILPAMPAFYHKPENISDFVDFVVGRALEMFGVEHRLYKKWGGGR
ncbi:MAG: UbiX family flavin prenyltransferase [Candidatus Hadarchaeota archaeon]